MERKLLNNLKLLEGRFPENENEIVISKYIEDFQSVMQQYAKSPKDFFIMTITSIVRLIFYYSIPYFIYAMMKGFDSSLYVNFVVMSLLVDMASSFFPLPGGTGMNEISFSAMFASLFDHTLMTFWKFATDSFAYTKENNNRKHNETQKETDN